MSKYVWFWLPVCIVFALDRVTKLWASDHLTLGESVVGIPNWYNWSLFHNPGAAGGMFSGHLLLLILVAIVAAVAIVYFVYKGPHDRNAWLMIGLGLMMGGALGNLFDRVVYGYVIDFIEPVNGAYIYNPADKGIHYGMYVGLLGLFLSGRKIAKERKNVVS